MLAFGVLRRPMPAAAAARLAARAGGAAALFAVVIAGGLLVFDVALRRREIPRILRDLVQGIAYFITAAIVLTRSEVDVTQACSPRRC